MMIIVPVSSVAGQVRGVSYAKGDAIDSPRPGYVMLLRANNITESGLRTDDVVYVPASRVAKKQRLLPGDIVIAASSGSLDVVGKAAQVTKPIDATFGAFCKVVRPSNGVEPAYLASYFRSAGYRRTVSNLAAGANINNLRNEHIDNLELPLPHKNGKPDLDEQKRIAAILDKADDIRRKRQQALRLTDDFLRSVFLDLFGDPVTNPKGWEIRKSGELFSDKPRLGTTRPATGNGYLVVRVGEIGSENVAFGKCGRVEQTEEELRRFRLLPGDILIARAIGSRDQLGKCSFFHGHEEVVVGDSHVMRLRPDSTKCHPYWLYFLLSSPAGKLLLQSKGGATAVQFNINSAQASDLNIPVPPIDLQIQFVELASKVRSKSARDVRSTGCSEMLFASLQHRAFRGEL